MGVASLIHTLKLRMPMAKRLARRNSCVIFGFVSPSLISTLDRERRSIVFVLILVSEDVVLCVVVVAREVAESVAVYHSLFVTPTL